MIIEDGTGTGRKAGVTLDNRLAIQGPMEPRMTHESKHHERSYTWTAISEDLGAGGTALLVANTSSTLVLHISQIYMWADVSTQFKIHCPAYPTLAGTAVTGNNLNRTSGLLAEASAYANETGNTLVAGNVIYAVRNNEVGTDQFGIMVDFSGSVVLGYHDSIAVDVVADSAAFECTIMGYYEEPA